MFDYMGGEQNMYLRKGMITDPNRKHGIFWTDSSGTTDESFSTVRGDTHPHDDQKVVKVTATNNKRFLVQCHGGVLPATAAAASA